MAEQNIYTLTEKKKKKDWIFTAWFSSGIKSLWLTRILQVGGILGGIFGCSVILDLEVSWRNNVHWILLGC